MTVVMKHWFLCLLFLAGAKLYILSFAALVTYSFRRS